MLILPFTSVHIDLANAGGKGLNLARLARAGFAVPPGFIVTTNAYQAYVEANQLWTEIQSAIENLMPDDVDQLERASTRIRSAFTNGTIPVEIEQEIRAAYEDLGSVPVAVRSSATTEDLPDLSFAGQQDTFLNVRGESELIKAIVDCWSSLWTARAISYRARNGVNHEDAALAVVVQELVESDASGVLFTANPLTGRLNEMVVDATIGLGEALVSGQVEPDHFVVDVLSGRVVEHSIGEKLVSTRLKVGGGVESVESAAIGQPSISEGEVEQLVALGQVVQKEYGSPQDIEWALAGGELYLLQSRPITSLFPVPEVSFDPLIVWLSFGSVQGLVGPITPLGRDIINHLIAGAGRMFRLEVGPDEQKVFESAGERIWARISGFLRHPLGVKLIQPILQYVEPSAGRILGQLIAEPRLGAGTGKFKLSTLARLLYFSLPIMARFIGNVIRPERVRHRFETMLERGITRFQIASDGDRSSRLTNLAAQLRSTFSDVFPALIPAFVPILGPSMGALNLLNKISGEDRTLALAVTRGVPGNVTSEMDLALWRSAVAIRDNADSAKAFKSNDSLSLVAAYRAGTLPPVAQETVSEFMSAYGMRGVGEIDFGQPRWREEPGPIIDTLKRYLEVDPADSPEALFAQGEVAAEAAIEKMVAKASEQSFGWLKARLVRAAARRIRLFIGLRESPKFFIVRLMGLARRELLQIGELYAEDNTISAPGDLAYLTLNELEGLARGERRGWQGIIASRREAYRFEQRRRQVPRILVSDGRAFYEGLGAQTDTDEVIVGSPVSPGVVEGVVRVVLDARGAELTPGEILVCPGTDPAWTPLLMAAGGLIMEVGGLMTHGSVVAREFGIPAVVGVHQATERLRDGQRVKLDGSTGEILVQG